MHAQKSSLLFSQYDLVWPQCNVFPLVMFYDLYFTVAETGKTQTQIRKRNVNLRNTMSMYEAQRLTWKHIDKTS